MTGTTHAEFTRRQQSARERAAIIRRARAALADIEQEAAYLEIARRRIGAVAPLFAEEVAG